MQLLKAPFEDLIDFLYPRYCLGCGDIIQGKESTICYPCLHKLPATQFGYFMNNPAEKIFAGRFSLEAAHCEYYFQSDKTIQSLIHALKYKGKKDVGSILGKRLGNSLIKSGRFAQLDYIIPVPMHPKKITQRGYNQAGVIAEGVSDSTGIPVVHALRKMKHTDTQTHKSREERWLNMQAGFENTQEIKLEDKQVLLLDDVLTTGATLEACARVLLNIPKLKISIATLAFAEQ